MLAAQYQQVRSFTTRLAAPLGEEDCVVQSMPDASPTKWHLAHTSWFFEQFVLARFVPDYRPVHADYGYLFNSYYDGVGPRQARAQRGMLTRPSLAEVKSYREEIDRRLLDVLQLREGSTHAELASTVTLGLHHEQQHQELLLTDILHAFSLNPLLPAYLLPAPREPARAPAALRWLPFSGGVVHVGQPGNDSAFGFDNERPRHRVFLEPYALASRPVTNAELAAFIDDGGYRRPELWLADGWSAVTRNGWTAPLYWTDHAPQGARRSFTLHGLQPLDAHAPVCHVSYYEADAYARWCGARLPTEAEWEHAAASALVIGNFVETMALEPLPAVAQDEERTPALVQLFGDVWEWSQSAYAPYPGFSPLAGNLGEYNGKFMCNQLVLRGGSCASSATHLRASYRNFFPPDARWQWSGIRLARAL